ncbi:MAG: hypothetical protein JO006_03485 [Paucibacter sp.]|nr:hypothetical protein [Roseateles sp.]
MTRGTGKPFTRGTSGNPAGRKPGSGEIGKLRAAIAKHLPEIIAKQVELALAGDAQAARLLLERVLPPVKAVELAAPISLPADGSLVDQGRAVLKAAGAGDLAPSQAAQMLAGLSALAGLIETDDLAKRIAAMERAHGQKPEP